MGWRKPGWLLMCLVIVVTVISGGVASAFWSHGSDDSAGSAATGSTLAVALSPGTPTASQYPGSQTNVVLRVSNPNASPIFVGSLVLDTSQGTGGLAVDTSHSGCGLATLSFTTQTNGGVGWTIPAKVGAVDGTLPITLANALAMSTSAANACQGASFTVYLVAGP